MSDGQSDNSSVEGGMPDDPSDPTQETGPESNADAGRMSDAGPMSEDVSTGSVDGTPQQDGRRGDRPPPSDRQDPGRFPTTRRSWITRTIAKGPEGEREVAHFVMSVYLGPLNAYARSIPNFGEVDPEDVVHEFLTRKVNAPNFFQAWTQSELPLRRWLVNGYLFLLKDRRRHATTYRQRTQAAGAEIVPEFDEARFADFEREWARDLVRRAVMQTEEYCRTRDLEDHWTVFKRHHLDGTPYRDLVDVHQLPARRLARMSRTAADRLRVVFQELLERDGVGPDDINSEINRLLELVR